MKDGTDRRTPNVARPPEASPSPRRAAPPAAGTTRRDLLRGGAVLASLGVVGACARLVEVPAAKAPGPIAAPRTGAHDVEALAVMIRETPTDRLFDAVADQLRRGVPESGFRKALLLAAVRDIDPTNCEFGLHSVFVQHSASVLESGLPREERLLPWFWAMDDFRSHDEAFRMAERTGPQIAPERAGAELDAAMRDWDEDRADAAIVAVWRAWPTADVFDRLWEYAARDYWIMGHKAIYAANLKRCLDRDGVVFAEPALRSLVRALLARDASKTTSGLRTYEANSERAVRSLLRLPAGWDGPGGVSDEVPRLAGAIVAGDGAAACDMALEALHRGGVQAGDVWDAVHLAAAILVFHQALQPGPEERTVSVGHAATSADSLHFAYRASTDHRLRLLLALQGVAWVAEFAAHRHVPAESAAAFLAFGEDGAPSAPASPEDVFACLPGDPALAARGAFAMARRPEAMTRLVQAACHDVVTKSRGVHGYKHAAAMLEDLGAVGARWRPYVLAAAVSQMPGGAQRDSAVIERARACLKDV